jgi:hypothetical protein
MLPEKGIVMNGLGQFRRAPDSGGSNANSGDYYEGLMQVIASKFIYADGGGKV